MTAAEHRLSEQRPTQPAKWLAIGAAFALCDFLLPPSFMSMNGPPITLSNAYVFSIAGCTLAQGNLLAVWLVWSSDRFARRLARHWGAAAFLYLCWLGGLALCWIGELALSFGSDDFRDGSLTVALLVPAVSLGAQFPHWIVRHYFTWRLVRAEADAAFESDAPLTIRDLLLATVVVAATFGIARQLPRLHPQMNNPWVLVAIVMTIAGVISTIALLPAGALLFKMKDFKRGLAWSAAYTAALVALEWAIVGILWWRAPQFLLPYQLYVGLSCLMLSFAGTLILVAWAARADGYRLVSGRKPRS